MKEKLRIGREKYWAERRALPPKSGTLSIVPNNNGRKVKMSLRSDGNKSHRDYTVNKIALRRQQLVDSQLDIAIGYSYIDAEGVKIYTKHPNASTGEYLLNQLIGKPKESIEVKEEIRLNVDI